MHFASYLILNLTFATTWQLAQWKIELVKQMEEETKQSQQRLVSH